MPQATYGPDQRVGGGGPPVTMGPVGFWLDADGNVAGTDDKGQPQITPGMRGDPQGAIYYDATKDLNYNLVSGQKIYHSPVGQENGRTVYRQSLKGPEISDTGGGLVHGKPTWNPKTGTWDVGLDAGKVLGWLTAAGMTAGAANAVMAGTGAVTSAVGPSTAANMSATSAAISAPSSLVTGGGSALTTAATGGTGAALARYGAPLVGDIVNGIIQSRAASSASEAQQKYLEEALAYQKEQDKITNDRNAANDLLKKEQDARDFARLTGLDQQTQQHYLDNTNREAARYGDFTGNIAPFVASGQSANAKMAALLGLPAGSYPTVNRSGGTSGGGPSGPSQIGTGQNFDPDYIGSQLDAIYAKHGLTATGPGSGPTDKAYMVDAVHHTKEGWVQDYWDKRIADELRKAGIADKPPVTPTTASYPPPETTPAPKITTQPVPGGFDGASMITIQAPDGSTKDVPASEAQHWQAKGATIVRAA